MASHNKRVHEKAPFETMLVVLEISRYKIEEVHLIVHYIRTNSSHVRSSVVKYIYSISNNSEKLTCRNRENLADGSI